MNLSGLILASMLLLPAAADGTTSTSREVNRFLATRWIVVHSLARVDPTVVAELKSRLGQDDRLADTGEPFESTDIVSGRPSRRFLMGGHADTRWFVLYERGGLGHHLVLVVFDTAVKPPTCVLLARGAAGVHDDIRGWAVDLPTLQTALQKARMKPDEQNAGYF